MATTKKPPLQSSNNANIQVGPGAGKTIEETYQKKTQLEHILLRPDTYIGSIEKHTATLWVYEDNKMVQRSVSYVPGLYKIFDEILVNAADNKQRDPKMDCVRVDIDVEQNMISVYNNGDGVPVEIHQEEGIYVPEMIFGHLLTSSNYDDNEMKTTGGRNGYGAKLTNIFSTEFVIQTADGKRLKKYKQVFSNNMAKKSEPSITKCKANDNWTLVTFKPDLEKFKMTHLEDDVVALMKKRVVDIAGCLGRTVKVELNGQRVPVKSFSDYCDLYLESANKNVEEKIFEKINDRWEICFCLSEGQFQQVSFVNSIATIKGGTHVDYVTNQITNFVMDQVNGKNKKKTAPIKAHAVKNHVMIFVNALIDNPAFDSQTKETLTTRQNSFGSKCELSDKLKKRVANSGIVDVVNQWAEFKHKRDLKKTDGSKKGRINGITKLEDANDAGTKKSDNCTLILTEGDSAKSLAIAGLTVVGRDSYGVFPLRGKLLNVREASHKQIMENAEIQHIKQILGLQHGKVYDNVKSLRYGHLMIMTDQDHDGSHIKGLLINFIHSFWPSLLKIPSFLIEFITPIVKATKGEQIKSFYTIPQYESWKESLGGKASGWTIKYYKGLGTSTSEEAEEYFAALDRHRKDFVWEDEDDGDSIEMAFSKKKIEARKNWLRQFEPGTFLDQEAKLIRYSDFVNKELILFSMADLQRSIPSMVDGLKPGQRKILFCSFKRKFIKEAKVSQFSGYVSEHSAYHHGEQSLHSTIVGMAQDFVGSNNINLFQPKGQFGSRLKGGKDAASPRYIFTCLSNITRFVFHKDDDGLLEYLNEDGQSIEPSWYVPVIPMVLVNGSEGIGTGWSSYIPNYNPRDIIANIRRQMNDEVIEPMHPWYRGFIGSIEKTATKEAGATYTVSGIIEEDDVMEDGTVMLHIRELPVRRWAEDYKEFLESILVGSDKAKDAFIEDYKNQGDIATVHYEVFMKSEMLMNAKREGLLKKFKLTTSISTGNMHLFDPKGMIKKYDTPEQILEEFFHLRLEFYEKRKKLLVKNLEFELLKLENKVRFILAVVNGEIIVSNRKRKDLFQELHQKGFTPFPKNVQKNVVVAGATDDTDENEETMDVSGKEVDASDYDYLLSLAIGTLTLEKVQQLIGEKDKMIIAVGEMKKTNPRFLWLRDLVDLEKQLDEQDKRDIAAAESRRKEKAKHRKKEGLKPIAVRKVSQNVKKNNSKKANDTSSEETSVSLAALTLEAVKPKGRGGPRKAPAKMDKPVLVDIDEEKDDDERDSVDIGNTVEPSRTKGRGGPRKAPAKKGKPVLLDIEEESDDDDADVGDLQTRIAAYNIQSSPDQSAAMDMEDTVPEEEMDDKDESDEDFAAGPKGGKKKAVRKPAAKSKTDKPTAATKKRGPAANKPLLSQKLITELKPAESSGVSPDKKVRKIRASPFNKKSSSVLGRTGRGSAEKLSDSDSDSAGVSVEEVAPRARPQRANRGVTKYALSESEPDTDDSEFGLEDDSD